MCGQFPTGSQARLHFPWGREVIGNAIHHSVIHTTLRAAAGASLSYPFWCFQTGPFAAVLSVYLGPRKAHTQSLPGSGEQAVYFPQCCVLSHLPDKPRPTPCPGESQQGLLQSQKGPALPSWLPAKHSGKEPRAFLRIGPWHRDGVHRALLAS